MRNSGPKEMEDVNYTSDPRQGHPHMARLACEAERWQARGQSSSTSMLRENGPRTLDTHPSVPDRQSREAWHTLKTFYRTRELTGPADGVPPERETHSPTHRVSSPRHSHSQTNQFIVEPSLAVIHTLDTHTNTSISPPHSLTS